MNQGPICAKVYPEGIQPIKGNNCGLIPEGLRLPRKSVVRLTDRPDMTVDVYRERKTTTQQQQQQMKIIS